MICTPKKQAHSRQTDVENQLDLDSEMFECVPFTHLNKTQVSRHRHALIQQHHIARHEQGRVDLLLLAVSQNHGLGYLDTKRADR